jgi:hypothetical protein
MQEPFKSEVELKWPVRLCEGSKYRASLLVLTLLIGLQTAYSTPLSKCNLASVPVYYKI